MAAVDTRERLLDAAERLFAEQGFAATSLREITREADANLAAVNYHFGSKDGLLLASLHATLDPINEERLTGLDAELAANGGAPVELETLLRIFLGPAVRHFAQAAAEGRPCLLGQLHREPHAGLIDALHEVLGPVLDRFISEARRTLPHVSAQQLMLRGTFLMGAMLHVLGKGAELTMRVAAEGQDLRDPETLLESLVAFGAAGMRHA